jgi:alpha-galactosidase
MSDATRAILTAPEVIAVDQDPLGRQGQRVRAGATEVWVRELAGDARALLLLNRGDSAARIEAAFGDIGIGAKSAEVRDLWERADLGTRGDGVDAQVRPHAAVLLRVSPRT